MPDPHHNPNITRRAAPDADAIYEAMKLLRRADDETMIAAAERQRLEIGAVARVVAGLHDALLVRDDPAAAVLRLLHAVAKLDDATIRQAVKEMGAGLVELDEMRTLAQEVLAETPAETA